MINRLLFADDLALLASTEQDHLIGLQLRATKRE